MKNFIKLTSDGEDVYVNLNHVCYMKKNENGTRLYFSPEDDTRLLMFLNPRNVFVHLRMMKPKERNSQQPYNQCAVVVESFTSPYAII